jgi:molybdate transport system substrate-binding protein
MSVTVHRSSVALAAVVVGLFLPSAGPRDARAQGAPLRVLASNGVKAAMEELRPLCEREIGRPIALDFSSTAGLRKRIESGEAFDVTIITVEAIEALSKAGKVAAGTGVPVGRSQLGIGIRTGTSRPDIRTRDALKAALRNAASITYPQDGATRGSIEQMFERLGIAAEIKPRIILASGSVAATESVAAGKAAMVLTLFSEILPIHGVEVLGALPGEFATEVKFDATTSPTAKDSPAAKSLIALLASAKTTDVFKAKGVERR